MKAFIVLAFVAMAAADVSHVSQHPEHDAKIEAQNAQVNPDGFAQSFQTSNGIQVQESGQLKNPGSENEALEVKGDSHYTAPDGTPIRLSYIADEFGYHPQGDHLPTPPPTQPIPEAIARSIAYIAAHPPKPENLAGRKY